ncbi:MAG: penicillin-binding protein 2, partial [Rhodospirillales bacterium]|nr:penicillin-binding protein 2 [Acetobacter sp.]
MSPETPQLARKEKVSSAKLAVTQYVVALVLLVLGIGLWRLQVLGASEYRVLAEQNRIRKVPVLAARGRILDREGRVIVDNYPSVTCYLLREQMNAVERDMPLIAQGLHMEPEQIRAI